MLPHLKSKFPRMAAIPALGGLTQKTGYSFRLATPLIAAYTDITSIVTPAEPLVFKNVVGYVDNVNAIVGFNYPGAGPVTVSFAKNLDFDSDWARKVVLTN